MVLALDALVILIGLLTALLGPLFRFARVKGNDRDEDGDGDEDEDKEDVHGADDRVDHASASTSSSSSVELPPVVSSAPPLMGDGLQLGFGSGHVYGHGHGQNGQKHDEFL